MKKTAFLGSLCVVLAATLFSCKKDIVTPEPEISIDHSAALRRDTVLNNASVVDDTRSLQAQLNAGDVTLIAGKTYHVSQLNVKHALNMNGATIVMNTTWYGFALSLVSDGASVTNGTLKGLWNNTTSGNPSGYSGIYILANHCSVSHVDVSSFSAYGIVVDAVNSSSVTYCNISNTGYIGYFYDAESRSTTGGNFSYNTVDRSMLPASTIQQMAIGVRGSVNNPRVTATNWTITNNVLKMPAMPYDWTAECAEIRYCNNTYIANNITTGGSIGISIVNSKGNVVLGNTTSLAKLEGIEFADCINCKTYNNIIPSSSGVGILIDGSSGCDGVQLNGDKISGTKQECIHAYSKTQNLTISGCNLSSSTANTFGINLQKSKAVKIQNTTMDGNGLGNNAVVVDNCSGNISLTGGKVSNFKSCVISIYNSTYGLVTDNVVMSGVTVSGVPKALIPVLTNGGVLGTGISFSL